MTKGERLMDLYLKKFEEEVLNSNEFQFFLKVYDETQKEKLHLKEQQPLEMFLLNEEEMFKKYPKDLQERAIKASLDFEKKFLSFLSTNISLHSKLEKNVINEKVDLLNKVDKLQKQYDKNIKRGIISNEKKAFLIIACIFSLGLLLAFKKVRNRLRINNKEKLNQHLENKLKKQKTFLESIVKNNLFNNINNIPLMKNAGKKFDSMLSFSKAAIEFTYSKEEINKMAELHKVNNKPDKKTMEKGKYIDDSIKSFQKKYKNQKANYKARIKGI